MDTCPKCQTDVPIGTSRCPKCGFLLDVEDLLSDPNKPTIDERGNVIVKLGGWGTFAGFLNNPLLIIGLIFTGPPGWILIMLHAKACEKMRARALELAARSEMLTAAGNHADAKLYAKAIKENFPPEWRPDKFK